MDTTALGLSFEWVEKSYLLEVFLGPAAFVSFIILGDQHWLCREVNREVK